MIADLRPYPEYRESGLPWVGGIPHHWGVKRSKTLFHKMARPVRPEDDVVTCFRDGTVTLRKNRRTSGFTESLKEIGYQGVRRGDLVIHAMDAFAGAIGVSDSDGKSTPVYSVCQPQRDANSYYYAYIVREMSRNQWIAALTKGIRERSTDFRFEAFGTQFIPVPPPNEQAAIVRFLNHATLRIEKAIRAKRKVIALLNEQKQVIIHRAVTRGLDPNVKLKPSGIPWLGEIPGHWEEISVGAATNLIQTGPFGSQLHSHEYVDGGIPVINPSHLKDGQIIADTSISISPVKAKELERHKIKIGDIIAARRGELGRCAVVTPEEVGWICGTGSLLIRCKLTMFIPNFFQMVFASQGIRDSLSLASIGATMDNLNAGMVARLRIPMPSISEQNQIIEFVKNENQRHGIITSAILHEIDLLREYRTRLIADVVTGKLDVRQAAARLPDNTDGTDSFVITDGLDNPFFEEGEDDGAATEE